MAAEHSTDTFSYPHTYTHTVGIHDAGKAPSEPSRYNPQFLRDTGATQETDLDVLGEQIEQRIHEIEARDAAAEGSNMADRLSLLKQTVSLVVFDFVRTGLFEKDKLTVVTLVTLRIMIDEGLLNKVHLDCIMRGRAADEVTERGAGDGPLR